MFEIIGCVIIGFMLYALCNDPLENPNDDWVDDMDRHYTGDI